MPILQRGSTGPDVTRVQQRLLELGFDPNGIDGNFGPGTEAAVKAFQQAKGLTVDGKVGPITWEALGIPPSKMRPLTLSDFQSTGWPVSTPSIQALVNGILTTQESVFAKHGITKDIHIVHMMAQFSHECGKGTDLTESLNYRPSVLLSQWPSHFTSAQAQAYGRTTDHPANQKMIGELAYGGRMGNAPTPSEDGYKYRGRGLIQTTGKEGYAALATLTGLDLVNSPEIVTDPTYALECGVSEFVHYPQMLAHCEADDLLAVSSLINVGYLVSDPDEVIGYADRAAQLKLWKHQYGI